MIPAALAVPAYNESSRWDPGYWLAVREASPSMALIFVDDGSSDGTAELLEASAASVGASVLRL
jgi:glycosyltransferase involved in cell wall biosynthesis